MEQELKAALAQGQASFLDDQAEQTISEAKTDTLKLAQGHKGEATSKEEQSEHSLGSLESNVSSKGLVHEALTREDVAAAILGKTVESKSETNKVGIASAYLASLNQGPIRPAVQDARALSDSQVSKLNSAQAKELNKASHAAAFNQSLADLNTQSSSKSVESMSNDQSASDSDDAYWQSAQAGVFQRQGNSLEQTASSEDFKDNSLIYADDDADIQGAVLNDSEVTAFLKKTNNIQPHRKGGVLSNNQNQDSELAKEKNLDRDLYFNNGNRIIRKAVIVSKVYHRPVGGAIMDVAKLLNNLGVEAYIDQSTAVGFNLGDVPVLSRRGMKETDLIIVVGGDGSVLGASRSLVDLQVPFLGINRGHLGLLTDISPNNIEEALTKVVQGNYTTESRMMLDVKVLRRDDEGSEELIGQSLAFNETVIHSGILAHMIVCRVAINGRYMYTLRSDGIIVGTPTGSTAYSLSAGGPIIEPHLDVLCLVPMFPQSLNCSPIILPGKSNVEVEFEVKESMPEWVNINCDGQVTIRADTKCVVNIKQHVNQLQLIHPAGYDYYSVLRQKLGWGQSLVN